MRLISSWEDGNAFRGCPSRQQAGATCVERIAPHHTGQAAGIETAVGRAEMQYQAGYVGDPLPKVELPVPASLLLYFRCARASSTTRMVTNASGRNPHPVSHNAAECRWRRLFPS